MRILRSAPRTTRKRSQGGNVFIEFALITVFLLIPLFLGSFSLGMSLIGYLQNVSLCQSVGRIFVTNTADFSLPATQAMVVRLAQGTGLDNTGNPGLTGGTTGHGLVILSWIRRIGPRECNTLGTTALQNTCNNEIANNTARYVFLKRVIIGNNTLGSSVYGAPTCTQISDGSIKSSDYMTLPLSGNCAAVSATTMGQILALNESEDTYAIETQFIAPELDLVTYGGGKLLAKHSYRNLF